MRALGLALRFLWIGVAGQMQYRANFVAQLARSLVGLALGLAGLGVVLSNTPVLAGWRARDLLALLGVYTLVGGVIGLFVRPSMQALMRDVHLGRLDFALVLPEDAQLVASVGRVNAWSLFDVALGLGMIGYSALATGHMGILQVLTLVVTLLAGLAVVYSFWLALACSSFWLLKVENVLLVFDDLYEAARWPLSIYPGWLRWALTLLVPVALAVTFPAQTLRGQLGWWQVTGAVAAASVSLWLSRRLWLAGLRRYSGASS